MSHNLVRLNYSHKALADQLIADPTITNRALAVMFGRSPEWVSYVRNSDMFLEFLASRRAEIVDPTLTDTVEERFNSLTRRSLEVFQEKMARPAEEISDDLALEAIKLGAKVAGVGGFGAKVVQATIVDPSRIERLAARLESLGVKQPVSDFIDITATEVPGGGPADSTVG